MIASATNGKPVDGSGSIQDFQHPSSIWEIILRFREISPARMVSSLGIIPGFLTCTDPSASHVLEEMEDTYCHQIRWISSDIKEFKA